MQIGKITSTPEEAELIKEGMENLNSVLSSDCFSKAVYASNFTENLGLKPDQIYAQLKSNIPTVNVVVFDGTFYQNHISKTIGYEVEPGTVYVNRYYVQSAYEFADNLIHEGEGHSQGFRHDGVKSTSEPYGMNDIFESCAKKKLEFHNERKTPHRRLHLCLA